MAKIFKLIMIIIVLFILLGFCFFIGYMVGSNSDKLFLGKWYKNYSFKGVKNFIKIRVDDIAITQNIENTIRHEMGHEIYYRIHKSVLPINSNEKFAEDCEKDLIKCVNILNKES